jgi:uncharacterized membrane protein
MTNLIVASFENEDEAIDISRKLSRSETLGEITIYERVIVRRNRDNTASVLQADITDGFRSISGLALDTLVTALGGPVGMAVGILSGSFSGRLKELNYFGFPEDFELNLLSKIFPGEVSIIAEIDENNSNFLDSLLTGRLLRINVDYEYPEYAHSHIESVDEEIAMRRIRMKAAGPAEISLLLQRISDLKEKRRRKLAELDKKAKEVLAKSNASAASDREKVRNSLHELKIARLKSRIEKHQMILAELRNELKHLEGVKH